LIKAFPRGTLPVARRRPIHSVSEQSSGKSRGPERGCGAVSGPAAAIVRLALITPCVGALFHPCVINLLCVANLLAQRSEYGSGVAFSDSSPVYKGGGGFTSTARSRLFQLVRSRNCGLAPTAVDVPIAQTTYNTNHRQRRLERCAAEQLLITFQSRRLAPARGISLLMSVVSLGGP
jgi:hypothetical protein